MRLVVSILRHALRPHDTVARLGGDEFAVLIDQRREAAQLTARRLRAALAEHAPASAGLACLPCDSVTGEELCRQADAARYASKARPRGKRSRGVQATTSA